MSRGPMGLAGPQVHIPGGEACFFECDAESSVFSGILRKPRRVQVHHHQSLRIVRKAPTVPCRERSASTSFDGDAACASQHGCAGGWNLKLSLGLTRDGPTVPDDRLPKKELFQLRGRDGISTCADGSSVIATSAHLR